jgi:hypothetical protein
MFGSLRAKAHREVRRHVSANPALRSFQRGVFGRIADFIFKDRGPVWFIGLYLATVVVIVSADFLLHMKFPGLPQNSSLNAEYVGSITDEINRVFLAVQATLIGVIFPIAIALVALLLQQRGQTFSSSRIDVYYRESRAFEIGGSSIMLIIVLVAQQFTPISALSGTLIPTPNTIFAQTALAVTHGFWLALNALAIWQFLVVSFTFISPSGQQFILRRFVARESVPRDLEDRLTRNYLANPEFFGLLPRAEELSSLLDGQPSVQFGGIGSDIGVVEVEAHQNGTQILHDVRFCLIKWVVSRWLNRTNQTWNRQNQQSRLHAPTLVFPHEIGRRSFGTVCLCRRAGGSALISLEKKAIKHGFVFREVGE